MNADEAWDRFKKSVEQQKSTSVAKGATAAQKLDTIAAMLLQTNQKMQELQQKLDSVVEMDQQAQAQQAQQEQMMMAAMAQQAQPEAAPGAPADPNAPPVDDQAAAQGGMDPSMMMQGAPTQPVMASAKKKTLRSGSGIRKGSASSGSGRRRTLSQKPSSGGGGNTSDQGKSQGNKDQKASDQTGKEGDGKTPVGNKYISTKGSDPSNQQYGGMLFPTLYPRGSASVDKKADKSVKPTKQQNDEALKNSLDDRMGFWRHATTQQRAVNEDGSTSSKFKTPSNEPWGVRHLDAIKSQIESDLQADPTSLEDLAPVLDRIDGLIHNLQFNTNQDMKNRAVYSASMITPRLLRAYDRTRRAASDEPIFSNVDMSLLRRLTTDQRNKLQAAALSRYIQTLNDTGDAQKASMQLADYIHNKVSGNRQFRRPVSPVTDRDQMVKWANWFVKAVGNNYRDDYQFDDQLLTGLGIGAAPSGKSAAKALQQYVNGKQGLVDYLMEVSKGKSGVNLPVQAIKFLLKNGDTRNRYMAAYRSLPRNLRTAAQAYAMLGVDDQDVEALTDDQRIENLMEEAKGKYIRPFSDRYDEYVNEEKNRKVLDSEGNPVQQQFTPPSRAVMYRQFIGNDLSDDSEDLYNELGKYEKDNSSMKRVPLQGSPDRTVLKRVLNDGADVFLGTIKDENGGYTPVARRILQSQAARQFCSHGPVDVGNGVTADPEQVFLWIVANATKNAKGYVKGGFDPKTGQYSSATDDSTSNTQLTKFADMLSSRLKQGMDVTAKKLGTAAIIKVLSDAQNMRLQSGAGARLKDDLSYIFDKYDISNTGDDADEDTVGMSDEDVALWVQNMRNIHMKAETSDPNDLTRRAYEKLTPQQFVMNLTGDYTLYRNVDGMYQYNTEDKDKAEGDIRNKVIQALPKQYFDILPTNIQNYLKSALSIDKNHLHRYVFSQKEERAGRKRYARNKFRIIPEKLRETIGNISSKIDAENPDSNQALDQLLARDGRGEVVKQKLYKMANLKRTDDRVIQGLKTMGDEGAAMADELSRAQLRYNIISLKNIMRDKIEDAPVSDSISRDDLLRMCDAVRASDNHPLRTAYATAVLNVLFDDMSHPEDCGYLRDASEAQVNQIKDIMRIASGESGDDNTQEEGEQQEQELQEQQDSQEDQRSDEQTFQQFPQCKTRLGALVQYTAIKRFCGAEVRHGHDQRYLEPEFDINLNKDLKSKLDDGKAQMRTIINNYTNPPNKESFLYRPEHVKSKNLFTMYSDTEQYNSLYDQISNPDSEIWKNVYKHNPKLQPVIRYTFGNEDSAHQAAVSIINDLASRVAHRPVTTNPDNLETSMQDNVSDIIIDSQPDGILDHREGGLVSMLSSLNRVVGDAEAKQQASISQTTNNVLLNEVAKQFINNDIFRFKNILGNAEGMMDSLDQSAIMVMCGADPISASDVTQVDSNRPSQMALKDHIMNSESPVSQAQLILDAQHGLISGVNTLSTINYLSKVADHQANMINSQLRTVLQSKQHVKHQKKAVKTAEDLAQLYQLYQRKKAVYKTIIDSEIEDSNIKKDEEKHNLMSKIVKYMSGINGTAGLKSVDDIKNKIKKYKKAEQTEQAEPTDGGKSPKKQQKTEQAKPSDKDNPSGGAKAKSTGKPRTGKTLRSKKE